MTSKELRDHLKEFFSVSTETGDLMRILSAYQNVYKETIPGLSKILSCGKTEELASTASQLKTKVITGIREIRDISPKTVFAALRDLEEAIKSLGQGLPSLKPYAGALLEVLEDFGSKYDEYLMTYDNLPTIYMLHSAENLKRLLGASTEILEGVMRGFSPSHDLSGQNYFSLALGSELDLEGFTKKIRALNVVYSESCHLLGVSRKDYPARISRVESGSLWAELIGNPKVIAFITGLVSATATYFYHRFSQSGRIEALPKKLEAVEAILEISKKLRELGVDTSGIDELLSKSTIILATELNNLLLGEPYVEIRDRNISISAELGKPLLEKGREPLALAATTESEGEDEDA